MSGVDFDAWHARPLNVAVEPYPFNSASRVIVLGCRDRDTDTGSGVKVWRRQMRRMGYGPRRWGRFGWRDAAACMQLQGDSIIYVDGKVGPQTWLATFDVYRLNRAITP